MVIDRHRETLVSTAWLAAHLDDPDLRIFECTTHLRPAEPDDGVPYHPEAGFEDHGQGHIPGAGLLDLPGALSRQDTALHFMMLPAERFAEVMGRQGIGEGTRVVLYSRGPAMWATRAWWMLHVMGFPATVLDGGFEKWLADGHPQSTLPCGYPPATFTPRPEATSMVAKEAVLEAINDPATCLINTLSVADFTGDEPSRYGRPGRIPNSANLPWADLTDPQTGTFIPLDRAQERLAAIGADRADRVLCYCGGGISATMALFLLHRLGHDNLALYDASMSEWARDASLPIERG